MSREKTPGRGGAGAEVDELKSCAADEKVKRSSGSRLRKARTFIAVAGCANQWAWAVVSEGIDVPPSLVARRLAPSQAAAFESALSVLAVKLPRFLVAQIVCASGSLLHSAVARFCHNGIRSTTATYSSLGRVHAENLAQGALHNLKQASP